MDAATIQAEHARLGFRYGWDFAITPLAKLPEADTVIIGLNPGGESLEGSWESTEGNAYFTGRWTADGRPTAIRTQVAALHDVLGLHQDEVFAAQFIPFRSKDHGSLEHQEASTAFALQLWQWVLPQSPAKRFICMGKEVTWHITKLLRANLQDRFPSGWGKVMIDRYVTDDGRVVVNWPHPSHYKLFSRADPKAQAIARASMAKAAGLV
jgi:hypothetical protein